MTVNNSLHSQKKIQHAIDRMGVKTAQNHNGLLPKQPTNQNGPVGPGQNGLLSCTIIVLIILNYDNLKQNIDIYKVFFKL